MSVVGCQIYLNKAGNVIECGRKGSSLGLRRPVSGHESVFSLVTLCKALHLFEHPFTCSLDSCIHSGNTWTCSVPCVCGAKEYNLYRETHLGQVAATSLTSRPWIYLTPLSFHFLICQTVIINPNSWSGLQAIVNEEKSEIVYIKHWTVSDT